jgi:protocatechuate 3,4-dioxygenase beta subunit
MREIIAGLIILSCIFCCGLWASDTSKTITCSGKVVDDSNKPIEGAKVTLFVPAGGGQESKKPITEEQITKEDGGFSFSTETSADKAYQFATVIARKEGFAIDWDNWQMREDKTTALQLGKPYTLSGVVVDEDGKPVGGVDVRIAVLLLGDCQSVLKKFRYLSSIEELDLLVTTTNANGVFEFDNVPVEAKAEFMIKKAGRATISTFNPRLSGGYNSGQYTVQSKDIRIIQPIEAKIEGKVVEKGTGKGIGGVKLVCTAESGIGPFGIKPVVSKDDGTFSFDGLESTTYVVIAADVVLQKEPAKWVIKSAKVTTAAGQTSSGLVVEASQGGILEITVRDNDKKQIAGANVYVRAKNDTRAQGGVSDANGVAAIRFAPGEYEYVGAYKEGYSSSREPQSITIEEGKTTRLDIEIKAAPKITGVVRDLTGRAVAGASVRIYPSGQKTVNSDKDGRFEILWNPEQWGSPQKPQYVLVARHREQNLASVIDIDEDTKNLDVKMAPGITFTGKVADPNGRPIASAKIDVTLRQPNWGTPLDDEGVTTDQQGRYEVKAVPQERKYNVSAQADGYGQRYVEADTYDAVENHLEIGPLTLKVANMNISGIVVDVNDKPVANAQISIYGEGQQHRQAMTDNEGKFLIDKLCEGQVQISANIRNMATGITNVAGSVRVEAGATDVKIIVTAPQGGPIAIAPEEKKSCRLEVVVRDENKKPIAHTRVMAFSKPKEGVSREGGNGITDINGVAVIRVAPGEYELQAPNNEGFSAIRNLGSATAEEGKTVRVEVELKSTPKISGVVRDPNGQPVGRALLQIGPGGRQNQVNSDKDGRFEISFNPEQWGNRALQPILVARHIRRNLAAVVEFEEDTKVLDVNLMPGDTIAGFVIDQNEKSIAGAKMDLNLRLQRWGISFDNAGITTDKQGRYEYNAIPQGQEYTIFAQAEGYGRSYVAADTGNAVNRHLEVKPLMLKTANLSISGIVVDINDKSAAFASVNVSGQEQQYRESTADRQGRFTIKKLCAGQVRVDARLSNGPIYLRGEADAEAGDTDVIVIVGPLNAGGRVSGIWAKNKPDWSQFEQIKNNLATLAQCENKEQLEAAIDKAKSTVDRFQEGHIIVGRIVLDGEGDVRDVKAQMEILPDGCFAGETEDLIKPVGFRMDGYAPYDLQLKGMKGSLVDVGTIHMTPLPPERLAQLKGKIVMEDNGDPSGAILYLSTADGPVNTPHNGTSPRSYWPEPITVQATANGVFEAGGFSPIKYYCRVTAPGYLEKAIYVEFNEGQTFDFGTVTLEIPKQIRLSYIVSVEPPFDISTLQNVTIPARTRWKAEDSNGCYGWDLEFGQNNGVIIMKSNYSPCYLRDLGKGEIANYVNVDKAKIGQDEPWNQKAKSEHVYLLDQEHWKRWVLFKIVIE